MAIHRMTFDQILHAAEDLTPDEQIALIHHLQTQSQPRTLSVDARMALLRAAQLHVRVNLEPSIRREDWYDDDGR